MFDRRTKGNRERRQRNSIAAVGACFLVLAALLSVPIAPPASSQPNLLASQGFAGSAACASCHPAIHRTHGQTAMRAALLPPASERALALRVPIEGTVDGASYRIRKGPDGGYQYLVEFGGKRLEAPIRWAFGLGTAGQTYVLEHQGALVESRVSYYDAVRGLDLTIGAANAKPTTVDEALGRTMSTADIRECFGCHALGVATGGDVQLTGIEFGVGCENCHGAAAAHVAARQKGDLQSAKMPSLKGLESEEVNQLCGKCHRTWEDVMSLRIRGVNNVRFQPYRLTLSKCYDSSDARIGCVACHNPHENPASGAAAYDARCQACHATQIASGKAAAACRAGNTAQCSSCHMPKRELPGAHRAFTDHYIRVHRQGEPYPDL